MSASPQRRLVSVAACAVIVTAVVAVYANSFRNPFVFDDLPTIVDNPAIRDLGASLRPPREGGLTVAGRPLASLSFALNHAIGGLDVRGYHAVNLALHVACALTLFGLVRRTLLKVKTGTPALTAESVTVPALFVALVWSVHPLQTAAVTYVVQRTEVLCTLFYLLTLYGFARATEAAEARNPWLAVSGLACLAGMATKEVMVSAPLVVWLYDRTFVSGSWREAWARHRGHLLALASTWLVLGWLVAGTGARGGTAGYGLGFAWWHYALTQTVAVVHYLRLLVWPHPLVLDYGGDVLITGWTRVVPSAAVLLLLASATLLALKRRPAAGFLGVVFFAVLAPSSSVVPLADTLFEHRMYLPSAACITLALVPSWRRWGARVLPVWVAAALVGGGLTLQRNVDYHSELAIWSDTVAKRPENARARYTLGTVLAGLDRTSEAAAQFEAALQLYPESAPAHLGYGNLLARTGRLAEAAGHYQRALQRRPRDADILNNLANALDLLGRSSEAEAHYREALRLRPEWADAHNNLGTLLARRGDLPRARESFEAALRLQPAFFDAVANLANVLAESGRREEALARYADALHLRPDSAEVRANYGTTLALAGRIDEAITEFEHVLVLDPQNALARENLRRLRVRAR